MTSIPAGKPYTIGSTVEYVRYAEQGLLRGTGKVKGIGVDPEGRVIVLVRDGENSFNVHAACINPGTEEWVKEFEQTACQVEELAKEGRKATEDLISHYNARIGKMWDDVIGKPLEF